MVASMTGFARQEATFPFGTLCWEIRSVNHRYLEPHFRLPESFRSLEIPLRNALRQLINRGKVEMNLSFQHTLGAHSIAVNTALVAQLSAAIEEIQTLVPNTAPVSALSILQYPGVVAGERSDSEQIHAAALQLFEKALQQLVENREREGAELALLIEQRLAAIQEEVVKVRALLPLILQAQRTKLTERITAIKEDMNQDRLEQELVIYAQKADVAEELDRLVTHVTEVRHTLKQKGQVGRRLDFLMQELNREANTLSSKSVATDSTQSAVELKILIEQMREQIQNIE